MVTVNEVTDDTQRYGTATELSNGDIVISFHDHGLNVQSNAAHPSGMASENIQCFIQLYDSTGTKKGSNIAVGNDLFRTSSSNYNRYQMPVVAAKSNGFTVMMEYDQNGAGQTHKIRARNFNNAGVAQGSVYDVSTYEEYYQQQTFSSSTETLLTNPYVVLDNDDMIIAWSSKGQDSRQSSSKTSVYMQRFYSNGTKIGEETQINAFRDYNAWSQYPEMILSLIHISEPTRPY